MRVFTTMIGSLIRPLLLDCSKIRVARKFSNDTVLKSGGRLCFFPNHILLICRGALYKTC